MPKSSERRSASDMERIYLTKNDKVEKDENNLVNITLADGIELLHIEPRRLFPVNDHERYITLQNEDGVEVAMIRSISDLSEDSQKVIRASLEDYYLVPKILKIISVVEKYGTLRWTVETERGIKSFDIRNRNHDIRVYRDGRVRVRDSDDNRYTIDDYNALDAHSRSLMIADL